MAATALTLLVLMIGLNQKISEIFPVADDCEDISEATIQSLWDQLMLGYDAEMVPKAEGVDVELELLLQAVNDISEISSSFVADFLFSQTWHDPGLAYDTMNSCIPNMSLSHDLLQKLWSPDVCFVDSINSNLHESPTANTFVLLFPNGTVWVNYRIKIEGPCSNDLSLYPLDIQECEVVLESYAHSSAKVRLDWRKENPVVLLDPNMKLAEFELADITWEKHHFKYAAGNWDQLVAKFIFRRSWGYYLLQLYGPSTITVFVSWTGFWFGHGDTAGRITLAITTLMILAIQFNSVAKNLPKVSYIKAVDVWMIFCDGFAFFSLVELALARFLEFRFQQRWEEFCGSGSIRKILARRGGPGDFVDWMARRLFPISWLIFNCLYWWKLWVH